MTSRGKKQIARIQHFKRAREQEAPPARSPLYTWTEEDQQYVEQITRRDLRLKIEERSRTAPEQQVTTAADSGPLERPPISRRTEEILTRLDVTVGVRRTRIEPIKSCRKCYFAARTRVLNTVWYCFCTNRPPARFVVARVNLPCWRKRVSDL